MGELFALKSEGNYLSKLNVYLEQPACKQNYMQATNKIPFVRRQQKYKGILKERAEIQ